MNELFDSKTAKPVNRVAEEQALRGLIDFLNNPTITGVAPLTPEQQAEVAASFTPPRRPEHMRGAPSTAVDLPAKQIGAVVNNDLTPSPVREEAPTPDKVVAPPVTPVPLGRKLFFTGRLCVGKDFVANKIGADIFGFADPIYSLAEYLLHIKVNANEGKDLPGVRKFLQTVGQWGRNEVSAQYPHTTERSMFNLMIRSMANQLSGGVDWQKFGISPDLWIAGLLQRVADLGEDWSNRICITNCRFPNEYKRLSAAGFEHWHVVCAPQTWLARLAEKKLDAKSPEALDTSEKLAADLNADLTKKLSAQKHGPKMRVVWSDSAPPPSSRLYTVEQFVSIATSL